MDATHAKTAVALILVAGILSGCVTKDAENEMVLTSHCEAADRPKTFKLRISFTGSGENATPNVIQSMTHDGPVGATYLTLCPADKVTFFGPSDKSFKVVFNKSDGNLTPFDDQTLESGMREVCWDIKPSGQVCRRRQATVARPIRVDAGPVNPNDPLRLYAYSIVGPCGQPSCTWDPVIIVEN